MNDKLINVQIKRLVQLTRSNLQSFSLLLRYNKAEHTYIFHHIPRCGGTSIRKIINPHFRVYPDYRFGWSQIYPSKKQISKLGVYDCLAGHFELENEHLFERYPSVLNDRRYKIFTFIRHPLNLKISLYYYEVMKKQNMQSSLSNYILNKPNYIANILDINQSNYTRILDRYDFIGIMEQFDSSLDNLGKYLGIDRLNQQKNNQAPRDEQYKKITESVINEFEIRNSLDYKIYDYCLNKYLSYDF